LRWCTGKKGGEGVGGYINGYKERGKSQGGVIKEEVSFESRMVIRIRGEDTRWGEVE